MKRIYLTSLVILIGYVGYCQTTVSTNITTPTTWVKSKSPYLLTAEIDVKASLTIQAGVTVQCQQYGYLKVLSGGLFINGAKGDSVMFTSNVTDTSSYGYGDLIVLSDSMANNTINYAVIGNAYYDGIDVYQSNLTITNSHIKNCSDAAILVENHSHCIIDSCLIALNTLGVLYDGIAATSQQSLTNSTITKNSIAGVYIYNTSGPVDIAQCTVSNNAFGINIETYQYNGAYTIHNNQISNDSIGINVNDYDSVSRATINYNNFLNNKAYNLYYAYNNDSTYGGYFTEYNNNAYYGNPLDSINAQNNYFGTTNQATIQSLIYDYNTGKDSLSFGVFKVSSFLTSKDSLLYITQQPQGATPCLGTGFALSAQSNYKDGANYVWYKDSVSLVGNNLYAGANTSTLTVTAAAASQAGTYTCVATAHSQTATSNAATVVVKQPYTLDSLCIATVSDNGKNVLLAWQRTQNKNTASYNIYREGLTNDYTKIGSKLFSDLSIFVDSTADVATRAYRYKMTTVDSCRNESPLATAVAQKTINLQTTLVNNKLTLNWSLYEGAVVNGYCVLAGNSASALDTIDKIGVDITNYTISNPTDSIYRVVTIFAKTIYPDSLKADTGPFSQSLSNMAESQLTDTKIITDNIEFIAFPNPAKQSFSCLATTTATNCTLYIIDVTGKIIQEIHFTSNTFNQIITLPPGVYTLKLVSDKSVKLQQIVVY